MNNLLARVLTAAVVLPFLILAINWREPYAVWALVFVATVIGLAEWMRLALPISPAAERWFGIVLGALFALALYWLGERPWLATAASTGVVLAVFLFYLFRFSPMETAARRIALMTAGIFYVGLLTFLALLKRLPDGTAWIYVALTSAWLSDTGAYFAGRFLGPYWPTKMYPSVSPKKTMVGGLGGLAASLAALVLAKLWYLPALSWLDCLAIAVPANLLGQMGDLAESLIKRSVGVKDSGRLLPGHGGMLDRVDALLFVTPYVFFYALWAFPR